MLKLKNLLREDAASDIETLVTKVKNYDEFVSKLGDLAKDPKIQLPTSLSIVNKNDNERVRDMDLVANKSLQEIFDTVGEAKFLSILKSDINNASISKNIHIKLK